MPSKNLGAFVSGSLSEAMHVVAGWVEEVHACRGFESVLGSMRDLLGAESALLLRLKSDTAAETLIASVKERETIARASKLSFPQYLLGHGIGQAQAGSVWYMSDLDRELTSDNIAGTVTRFGAAHVREIAVFVLGSGPRECDVLEIHFTRRLTANEVDAISMLASVLARAWVRRVEALWPVSEGAPDGGARGGVPGSSEPILSPLNPAGLSRSEYRVCTLLGRGLGAKKISSALSISESTVRSHLRSIYGKTRTNGQRELMVKLLGSDGSRRGTIARMPMVVEARERTGGNLVSSRI